MSIRRNGSKLPWGTSGGGVYSRSGGSMGSPLIMALVIIGLVAVAAFLFFQVCSSSCSDAYCATDRDIPPPDGFERVSKLWEYDLDRGQPSNGATLQVSLPLTESVDPDAALSFFRYVEETDSWEPVASANLEADGKGATGSLTEAPALLAVLRRLSPTGHVIAYLPKGADLHPQAVGKITLLHTIDFAPGADGSVVGDPTVVQGGDSFDHYPVISASAAAQTSAIVTSILATPESRSNHAQQIVARVQEANLQGIDISYFDLQPDQRSSFALFIAELATSLHRQGKKLTVTLPPPRVANDQVDEGGYDWRAIGAAADLVKLAPYRDQSRYRLDMPRILDHLTSVMDRGKLALTVTPYASELSSDGTIQTMSLAAAMSIATRMAIRGDELTTDSNVDVVGVNIEQGEGLTGMVWDDRTATVSFTYKSTTHRTVWLENFFSVGFKLEYVSQYRLGGVAVEDASDGQLLGNIWTAIDPFVTSGQAVLMRPNPFDLDPKWEVSAGDKDGGERAGLNGVLKWFTPSQPGTHTVKLQLSDGVALFESQISVNIQAREQAQAPTPAPSQ